MARSDHRFATPRRSRRWVVDGNVVPVKPAIAGSRGRDVQRDDATELAGSGDAHGRWDTSRHAPP